MGETRVSTCFGSSLLMGETRVSTCFGSSLLGEETRVSSFSGTVILVSLVFSDRGEVIVWLDLLSALLSS